MTWRRVPPVYSPVDASSIAHAALAAAGISAGSRQALSSALAQHYRATTALLTDSGTSALVLAIRTVAREGAVVAMPAYGCVDLIAAAIRARVRVALYDVDPDTLSPRIDSVRAALARGASALLVTPLYGYPPDMRALARVAADHGVPLIEDAAQAAGGTLDGTPLGAFGDVSVVSFGRGKGTTTGTGGALLARNRTDARAVAAVARARRGVDAVGALMGQWLLGRPELYALPASIPWLRLGEMVYREAGDPRGMSAAAAGALFRALALDADELRVRRRNAARLADAATNAGVDTVRPLSGAEPGYLRFVVLTTCHSIPRLGAMRPYPVTLDEHPASRDVLVGADADLDGARFLRDTLLTLPTHSRLAVRDVQELVAMLRSFTAREQPVSQPA